MNLEGRLQRQRRAVIAPCPDELAWIAKLPGASASSSPRTPRSSSTRSPPRCYGGISFGEVGEQSALPRGRPRRRTTRAPTSSRSGERPAAVHLPAALLRRRRRPHARAAVPAARRPRSSSPAPTRAHAASATATTVTVSLERHLPLAARAHRARPRRRHGAHRRRSTPRGCTRRRRGAARSACTRPGGSRSRRRSS